MHPSASLLFNQVWFYLLCFVFELQLFAIRFLFDPFKSVYRIHSFISSLYGVFSTSFTSTLNGVDHIKDVISENVK